MIFVFVVVFFQVVLDFECVYVCYCVCGWLIFFVVMVVLLIVFVVIVDFFNFFKVS